MDTSSKDDVNRLEDLLTTSLLDILGDFQSSLHLWFPLNLTNAREKIKAFERDTIEAERKIAPYGWFFGQHDGLQSVMELVEVIKHALPDHIDSVMIDYHRRNFEWNTTELLKRYPDRSPAIEAAIYAHTSVLDHGYYLSTPVFLAQADGILAEISGGEKGFSLAAQVGKKLRTNHPNAANDLKVLGMLQELPLFSTSAHRKNTELAPSNASDLNRHVVMHGLRSDYGTERNSLKAFSLLIHVALHIPTVIESAT